MHKTKRGVSAIVATVLLVLITVAAVGIVWQGILPLLKGGLELSKKCQNVQLFINTEKGFTCIKEDGNILLQLSRGSDETEISGIQVVLEEAGTSKATEIRERIDEEVLGSLWFNKPYAYAYKPGALGPRIGGILSTALDACKFAFPGSTKAVETTEKYTMTSYFMGKPISTTHTRYNCIKETPVEMPDINTERNYKIITKALGLASINSVAVAPIVKVGTKEEICPSTSKANIPKCA